MVSAGRFIGLSFKRLPDLRSSEEHPVISSQPTDCCMQMVLSLQYDFKNEKPQLQTKIEDRGHLCLFLPKFHCELNPIEMVWEQAKRCESCITGNIALIAYPTKIFGNTQTGSCHWHVNLSQNHSINALPLIYGSSLEDVFVLWTVTGMHPVDKRRALLTPRQRWPLRRISCLQDEGIYIT